MWVSVSLVSPLANLVLNIGTTSRGGYADGVLGCFTNPGEITLIEGWNWYAARTLRPSERGSTISRRS